MAKETQIKLTKTRYRLGAWELPYIIVLERLSGLPFAVQPNAPPDPSQNYNLL
jgi:hypothetical protein